MGEGLSEQLLEVLVCPIDHQALAYVPSENVLYNPRLKKSYDIKNGIPVMLIENASNVSEELHDRYVENALKYTGPRQTHAL